MVSSAATTVSEYLESLPAERASAIKRVRAAIRKQLPDGFKEAMQYGMISYIVPLKRSGETYNGQPLTVVSLASQKQHMAVYLMGVYGSAELRAWFEKAYARSGKKLDIGKSCLRFKRIEDLALDVVAEAVSRVSVDEFIAMHDAAHAKKKRTRRS